MTWIRSQVRKLYLSFFTDLIAEADPEAPVRKVVDSRGLMGKWLRLPDGDAPEDNYLAESANDKALYQAKESGRNRVGGMT